MTADILEPWEAARLPVPPVLLNPEIARPAMVRTPRHDCRAEPEPELRSIPTGDELARLLDLEPKPTPG